MFAAALRTRGSGGTCQRHCRNTDNPGSSGSSAAFAQSSALASGRRAFPCRLSKAVARLAACDCALAGVSESPGLRLGARTRDLTIAASRTVRHFGRELPNRGRARNVESRRALTVGYARGNSAVLDREPDLPGLRRDLYSRLLPLRPVPARYGSARNAKGRGRARPTRGQGGKAPHNARAVKTRLHRRHLRPRRRRGVDGANRTKPSRDQRLPAVQRRRQARLRLVPSPGLCAQRGGRLDAIHRVLSAKGRARVQPSARSARPGRRRGAQSRWRNCLRRLPGQGGR